MSDAPADLLAFRATVQRLTGLPSAAEVGIVGDGAHQHTGGYHEGADVLRAIGRYHDPATAHVGSSTEDYSARLLRDRRGLTNHASALDIGDNWPHGGRAAWLRFNNLLVAALHAGDPALAAIRAVNYSPDGTAKQRVDRENGFRVESSSDSVDMHTHHEWYRDTDGHRQACLDRMAALIQQAITGKTGEVSMGTTAMIHNADANAWAIRTGVDAPVYPGDDETKPLQAVGNPLWDKLGDIVDEIKKVSVGGVDAKAVAAELAPLITGPIADLTKAVNALAGKLTAAGHALDQ